MFGGPGQTGAFLRARSHDGGAQHMVRNIIELRVEGFRGLGCRVQVLWG